MEIIILFLGGLVLLITFGMLIHGLIEAFKVNIAVGLVVLILLPPIAYILSAYKLITKKNLGKILLKRAS